MSSPWIQEKLWTGFKYLCKKTLPWWQCHLILDVNIPGYGCTDSFANIMVYCCRIGKIWSKRTFAIHFSMVWTSSFMPYSCKAPSTIFNCTSKGASKHKCSNQNRPLMKNRAEPCQAIFASHRMQASWLGDYAWSRKRSKKNLLRILIFKL